MSEGQQIDLGAMPIDQLNSLKQQLEEEQQALRNNFISLREAQHRFRGSLAALSSLTPENQGLFRNLRLMRVCVLIYLPLPQLGKDILVPLTSSLYVPGSIASTEEVMVDIGTGYYVTKSTNSAKDFLMRKVRALHSCAIYRTAS